MALRMPLLALAVALISPALASQPGQPLDCGDWVFVEPGLSCSYWVEYPCSPTEYWCTPLPSQSLMDNSGRAFRVDNDSVAGACGSVTLFRHRILAFDGSSERVIAYIDDRCTPTGRWDAVQRNVGVALFAKENGQLITAALTSVNCSAADCTQAYPATPWVAVVSGFPTTFDVLQTYTPPPSQLGFRVPYMPEGLGGADRFDTYWGPLTKPIDFTQAHPLQCAYPATPPHVGDYETVADTLPTPAPDSGYYYLTATTYQGQTRDGRKTSGGKLSGRDPALLPACVMP